MLSEKRINALKWMLLWGTIILLGMLYVHYNLSI